MKSTGSNQAKIIVVFNQKGGCGKTMTTMQLAGTLGMSGLKVTVIDMDPQNTSFFWGVQAPNDQPFPATIVSLGPLKERFVEKIESIASKSDVIIIDSPPSIESRVPWVALNIADLAIIPVIPVMDNVWASKQAEQLVLEAQKVREEMGGDGLEAAYLLSMVRRGNVFDSCLEALKQGAGLKIFNSKITMRNVFPESQLWGCVAKSLGKSAASKEIDAMASEVCKVLKIKFKS